MTVNSVHYADIMCTDTEVPISFSLRLLLRTGVLLQRLSCLTEIGLPNRSHSLSYESHSPVLVERQIHVR
jgi:hypothetical protein